MRRTHLPRARGTWLALLVLLAAAPAAAQRMPGDTVEVLSLRFAGTTVFSDELLRSAIMTTPTQCISVALQPLCWVGISRNRQYYDPRALAADMLRLNYFYRQRGYRQATVALDTTRVPGGIHVIFRIAAGRPVLVHSITIEGADSLGRARPEAISGLTRNLPLRAGEPLNEIELYATTDSLTARLANRGYAGAEALANYDIRTDDPFRADVAYTVVPGPLTRFGPVTITGTRRVSPAVVERMLVFREGDLYSRQALFRSQRNLFGLEVFRHAEIVPRPQASGDSVLPVEVRVIEGDIHRVRIGLGASTSDYLSAEGRWVSRNFMGGGRRLELHGRVSNMIAEQLGDVPLFKDLFESCTGIYCNVAGSVRADFSQPWFFSPLNTLGAGLFVERFTVPDVYVRTSAGAYASVRRALLGNGVLTAGYRPELTELESDGDLIFCVNFVACEERDINVLRQSHALAPLALSFALDRSNSLFAPTSGYILRFDGEYAASGTLSDFSYTRLLAEGSYYHDPFRGVVYATRLRIGWARSLGAPGSGLGLHPQKRFFAGGPNSVRGFAQYRLGPKLLTVDAKGTLADSVPEGAGCTAHEINAGSCDVRALALRDRTKLDEHPVGGAVLLEGNLEVRFPVAGDFLRAAAFIDFGQVWRTEESVRLGQLKWTPGLGIRYFSPIGPLRVDVGYNPGGSELLTVVTTEVCDDRNRPAPCTDIQPDVMYVPGDLANRSKLQPLTTPVIWKPYRSFTDRLQFHFSIGQAF
jgi:outer membrane protein assembly factor BamA